MRPLLCLDLEGTLISNAVSQIPRPGLYQFLEQVAELCDLMLYTSVSFERVEAIRNLLVVEENAPKWFRDVSVIRPEKTLKPKAACGRYDAFLLDDQPGVIVHGEEDWFVAIPEYLPPYSASDRALYRAFEDIQIRVRLLEPSFPVAFEDL
jgi:hypothetical protein